MTLALRLRIILRRAFLVVLTFTLLLYAMLHGVSWLPYNRNGLTTVEESNVFERTRDVE